MKRLTGWLAPCAVFLLWLAVALPSLQKSRMQEVDELTHARVAQAAALEGHWWPLTLDGRIFYEKPPLMLWLAGATAKFSGQPYSTWPYRLWPCLGAGLALAFLVLIGALLERPWVGLIAAAGLILQGDFIYHGRFFTFDTLFVACMLASLALSLRAVRRDRPGDWLWAGAALGMAAVFKSWFVLSLAPAYTYALLIHVPSPQRKRVAWSLAWPSLLALTSWILLYVSWDGRSFLSEEWSNNLVGRIQGKNFTLDRDGHAAFYLKWVALSAPAILPWALSAPLLLASKSPGPSGAAGRAWAFARTWVCAFCLSWLIGLGCVRAETMNYVVPLEAGLCLAAGLTLMDREVGKGRAWVRTGLLAVSVFAALGLWGAVWSLAFGAGLGLAWLFLEPTWSTRSRALNSSSATALVLGLALAGLLGRNAYGLLTRPLDPNRGMAELLLAHPARRAGETLWFVAQPTQAPCFYSSYAIKQVDALPEKRPAEASLVKIRGAWIFFPAGGGPPSSVAVR